MKSTSTIFISLMMLLIAQLCFANNGLKIIDPQGSWRSKQGTIEEATIVVQPKGIYTEIGLYLTLSAKGTDFGGNQLLEIILDFDLPHQSIITDSWLWIEGEIVKAEIWDKKKASETYESIVNRRRDPSILYKKAMNEYQLRIYPLPAKEARKVKITYLVPTIWTNTSVYSLLPINILNTSLVPLQEVAIITKPDPVWKNAKLLEQPSNKFILTNDPILGEFLVTKIDLLEQKNASFSISFESPMENGIYLEKYINNQEEYYQMAISPSIQLNLNTQKKIVFIMEYDKNNTGFSRADFISIMKESLIKNLDDNDSFNLVLPSAKERIISDKWISADSSTIDSLFSKIYPFNFNQLENISYLAKKGADFIKSKNSDASIFIISNYDKDLNPINSVRLVRYLAGITDYKTPFHIIDYQSSNFSQNIFEGTEYIGNYYYLNLLANETSGSYYNTQGNFSLRFALLNAINSMNKLDIPMDVHTSLENGFCYNRFNIGNNINQGYLDQPILQIGKMTGSGSFEIKVSGLFENTIYSQFTSINAPIPSSFDSLMEEAWVGNYILELENQNQSDQIVNRIIDESMTNRILSMYTTFICLDTSLGGKICHDCPDETTVTLGTIDRKTPLETDSIITAYPNPFTDVINLDISLSDDIDINNTTFTIYNMVGKAIHRFAQVDRNSKNVYELKWEITKGHHSPQTGSYVFVVESPTKTYYKKIIYID